MARIKIKEPLYAPKRDRSGRKPRGASLKRACAVPLGEKATSGKENMNNNYIFDLHKDIVARQGKTCKRCKKSLISANRIITVDGSMYCGSCGELESRKAALKREIDRARRDDIRELLHKGQNKNSFKKSSGAELMRARAEYDRVRKSGK